MIVCTRIIKQLYDKKYLPQPKTNLQKNGLSNLPIIVIKKYLTLQKLVEKKSRLRCYTKVLLLNMQYVPEKKLFPY